MRARTQQRRGEARPRHRPGTWIVLLAAVLLWPGASGVPTRQGFENWSGFRIGGPLAALLKPVHAADRFRTLDGFVVEEVTAGMDTPSLIRLTFDPLGRPVVSLERGGLMVLVSEGLGSAPARLESFCDEVRGAQGICFLAPGDALVQAEGPSGAGLYRLTDTNRDGRADRVSLIAGHVGGMSEHGAHDIKLGPDGWVYLLYGNYARPAVELDPQSPSRDLREDHLLARYLDPRGHSNLIGAPGGTIVRMHLDTGRWVQVAGGLRNAYGMAIDDDGEIFTYDSDMEWDVGLPWYRPTRVLHVVEGGDYGWRTGSSKFPPYYADTLSAVETLGRGSPVGIVRYDHHVYPEPYRGAVFLGDWSHGRIRVMEMRREGATFVGESRDFITGRPLNVTDLAVGPDGLLYFTTGGRMTRGGLYRVRWEGTPKPDSPDPPLGIETVLDPEQSPSRRLKALRALAEAGSRPEAQLLARLARDPRVEVRSAAVYYLGTLPLEHSMEALVGALGDDAPLIARRACEALVRAGLSPQTRVAGETTLAPRLLNLLDHEDRFVRYSARGAIGRLRRPAWTPQVLGGRGSLTRRATIGGLLALILSPLELGAEQAEAIFDSLGALASAEMDVGVWLDYLRAVQLALIRLDSPVAERAFIDRVGPSLLERLPAGDPRLDRELQTVLAYMNPPGTIDKLLARLSEDRPQEEQIHAAYCLRAIGGQWGRDQKQAMVEWFDHAREFRGAVSMEGYLLSLWESTLALLTENEKKAAQARLERAYERRAEQAAALLEDYDRAGPVYRADCAQMTFEELKLYLVYDPTAYATGNADRGRWAFRNFKCAACHLFDSDGKGGGPDLSTVSGRLDRAEILESIMFPSRVVSDQYASVIVERKGSGEISGMIIGESSATVTLIAATGERIVIPKDEILGRRRSEVSIMPEGLIDTMQLHDLLDLVTFLESGGSSAER